MGILGIDIGGTNMRVGYIEDNRLVRSESVQLSNVDSEQETLDQLTSLIDIFSDRKTGGIGVGVPSVVDTEKGIVYDVQNIPSWKEVHLKEILENKYGVPVYVNNDANCFAAGEKYFGKAVGYRDVVGLIVGTGLGAGVITNGTLYTGSNCGAGEFGMISYRDSILEHYCCGQFFQNKYSVSGSVISERAGAGEAEALRIFDEFGAHLGEAIKIILYSLDPEMIVLGGSVSKSFRYFSASMRKSLGTFAYTKSLDRLKIEVSETENIAILGAAALYFDAAKQNSCV
ncbi:MAG: ROK family protein [Bacteroidota bacterium]